MLEFQQTLLYPPVVFLVRAYRLRVEELGKSSDNLVVELRELQGLVYVYVFDAATWAHGGLDGDPVGGSGIW